jgi:hypothetical protein
VPSRLEIDAARSRGLERPNFLSLLSDFWFLRRLYDWPRSTDFVFNCANRFPQQGD